jgi:penicillin V acylase-like amidase (Ntn superfamily)
MKQLTACFCLLLFTGYTYACSTFLLSKDGKHVFGRNYDWVSGNGTVIVNTRGVFKTSFMPDNNKSISWTSRYGSLSFNQFGKEFPHGGMNEKGLVVEMMWLDGTSYPAADQRASINELQWIQYQLDNSATIDEVIASDKMIRISRNDAAPLHYLVADSKGHAATIEFIKGKMVVNNGNESGYPVLTNTVYSEALTAFKTNKNNLSVFDNSIARFATACTMVQQFTTVDEPPVDYAFSILKKVSQGAFTKWSIVYDISNASIYFSTSDHPKRKLVAMRDLDFTCKRNTISLNLTSSQSGNVYSFFTPLSFEQNRNDIVRSARESVSHINISNAGIERTAEYFKKVSCR